MLDSLTVISFGFYKSKSGEAELKHLHFFVGLFLNAASAF